MKDHLHVWWIKGTEYFILQEIGAQDYIVGKWLATGWMVQVLNPGGGQIFHSIQTGPEEPNPLSCTEGTWSFPGVTGQKCGADHPPSPSASYKWVADILPPTACIVMWWGDFYSYRKSEIMNYGHKQ